MNKSFAIGISVGVLILILITLFAFGAFDSEDTGNEQTLCAQDVELCPDGSYVSRIPPSCNFAACPSTNSTTTATSSTSTDGSNNGATVTNVKIAVLDTEGNTGGKQRGCDRVVMLSRSVSPTTQPLNASLSLLFNIEEQQVNGYYNFIAKTNDTLMFDRATIENGTARVYLTGRLSNLGGVCDDPRAAIQIEETALQFPSVLRVELYLNGARTNLTPSEQ